MKLVMRQLFSATYFVTGSVIGGLDCVCHQNSWGLTSLVTLPSAFSGILFTEFAVHTEGSLKVALFKKNKSSVNRTCDK